MRKILLNLFLLCLCIGTIIAQERTVTGTVTDKSDGTPLPGVSVRVKGASLGTQTNANGKFTIQVPGNKAILVFTYIGYASQDVSVGNRSVVNISLGTDATQLGEVVVTALGISREAKSLGYTTQQVTAEDLTKARETNVINSLTGKVAGVRVNSQSGTLGGASKIIIRGQSSFSDLSGGQPIFVIDGLPIDNGSQQLATANSAVPQGTAGVDFGSRAGDINPDDIESINVLKGAAATALYGARAKNGAIVITTKKGSKGRTSVTLNSSTRFDNPLVLPSLQNEYAQGNQGLYSLANTNGWGPKISDVQDRTFKDFLGNDVTLRAYENNIKDFYQTGNTFLNSVSFDGGSETGDFRLGYSNAYQTGIVPNEELIRNSINLNAGKTISPKFDVRSALNYVSTTGKNRPFQSSNNQNVLTQMVNSLPRTVDIDLLRNNYIDPVTKQQIVLTPSRTGNNPFWVLEYNTNESNLERFYGNAVLNYKPLNWLSISNNFGADIYNEYRILRVRPGTVGTLNGSFFTADIFNRTLNNDFIARGNHKLSEDFQLTSMVGFNIFESSYRRSQSDAQQLTVDQLYTFSNASAITTTNTSNKRRIMGLFGELDLAYKNYLYLTVTGRNDWSSTLPVSNRSYFYPSVSSSFVFSELIPQNNILSFGKLRASWAQVGSDTGPYQLAFNYTPVSNIFGQYGLGPSFPFNGVIGFSQPSVIPNFNLKPQNQNSFEIGSELRFLKDRLKLDFTYYNTVTSDQIVALSLPQSTGFTSRRINAGAIKNSGVEIFLGGTPVRKGDFTWEADFNFAANKQKVKDLPSEIPFYVLDAGYNSLQFRATNGEAISLYGIGFAKDPQGNFIIDPETGLRLPKSNTRFGNMAPDWTLGFNNTLSYKDLSLSFLLDMRKGGLIYSGTVAALRSNGLAEETLFNRGNIFVDKGVIDNGDGTYSPNTIPVQSMQDYWGQFGSSVTEGAVFDASYVKLRELRLNYTLPGNLLANQKFIKGVDIGLEARNLWIIQSNIPHIDPEANIFGTTSVGEGYEFNNVPATRSFGFNVRARF